MKELKRKRRVGRPSTYNREVCIRLCQEISTTTRSLKLICEQNSTFPKPTTIYRWLSEYEEFREMYAKAKDDQVQLMADQLLEISDTPQLGEIVTVAGTGKKRKRERKTADMIEHRRLQVETRKWLLSKLRPRQYGERIEVDSTSNPLAELLAEMKKESERIGPPEGK